MTSKDLYPIHVLSKRWHRSGLLAYFKDNIFRLLTSEGQHIQVIDFRGPIHMLYVNVGIDPGIIIPTAFGSNAIVIIVQKRFVVGLRL